MIRGWVVISRPNQQFHRDSNADLRKVVLFYQESKKREERGRGRRERRRGQSSWLVEAERSAGEMSGAVGGWD